MREQGADRARAPWWKGARGEWYVVVQFALLTLIGFGPRALPGIPRPSGLIAPVAQWFGFALMLVGAAFALGGIAYLGQRNLTALPYPRDGAVLITRGPYAIVRNPIYTGLIFGSFGWALYLSAPLTLLFSIALFVLFDRKSRKEEAWLIERFPEYRGYCARVKRLMPWVY